ncbi:unnamed protein product [Merluccius merluccius]
MLTPCLCGAAAGAEAGAERRGAACRGDPVLCRGAPPSIPADAVSHKGPLNDDDDDNDDLLQPRRYYGLAVTVSVPPSVGAEARNVLRRYPSACQRWAGAGPSLSEPAALNWVAQVDSCDRFIEFSM